MTTTPWRESGWIASPRRNSAITSGERCEVISARQKKGQHLENPMLLQRMINIIWLVVSIIFYFS